MKLRYAILCLAAVGCLCLKAAMTTTPPTHRPIPYVAPPSDDIGIRLTCIDDGKTYIGRLRMLGGSPTLIWGLATEPFTTNLPAIVDIDGNTLVDTSGRHIVAK